MPLQLFVLFVEQIKAMSDESSLDGSEWQHDEGDVASWDSEDDLAVLMSQLCRVCGEASDDLVECFGEKGKEMLLVEKIHTHLPIMVLYIFTRLYLMQNLFYELKSSPLQFNRKI